MLSYELQAIIPTTDPDLHVLTEKSFGLVEQSMRLLSQYDENFATLGYTRDEEASQISAYINKVMARDEPITAEEDKMLSELNYQGHINFLASPQSLYQKELAKVDKEFPSLHLNYFGKGKNGAELSNFSILKVPNKVQLVLNIEFPCKEQLNTQWYYDVNKVKSLLAGLVKIWSPSWLVVYPIRYVFGRGYLFKHREFFGWMGYTSERVQLDTDTLAAVEPMHTGTFLLLKESIMTVEPEDVERANQAEAVLADHEILPTRDFPLP